MPFNTQSFHGSTLRRITGEFHDNWRNQATTATTPPQLLALTHRAQRLEATEKSFRILRVLRASVTMFYAVTYFPVSSTRLAMLSCSAITLTGSCFARRRTIA